MKSYFLLLFIALISFIAIFPNANLYSQTKNSSVQAKESELAIAKVGKEIIYFSDLERAYNKNLGRAKKTLSQMPIDSVKDFLDLYIKYRLKVADALNRGYDKDSSVIADIDENRRILAESFYNDKVIMAPNVEQMLNLRNKEFKIAIIVNQFDPKSNADTTAAFEKATKAIDELRAGVPFAEVARKYSDHNESAAKGGEITTFITSGKVQRPIENIIINLKPGEFHPNLIATDYGYFIVKLLESSDRKFVKASHILLSFTDMDTLTVKAKADSIYTLLISKKATFEQLARDNSDDPGSSANGGQLEDWYSRSTGFEKFKRQIFPELESAIFNLKDGQISPLIRSDYGYHIARRDSTKAPDPIEERKDVEIIYKRLYLTLDKQKNFDSLKIKFGLKIKDDMLGNFLSRVDTTKTSLDSSWYKQVPANLNDKTLFSLGAKTYSMGSFVRTLLTEQKFRATALNHRGLTNAINEIVKPDIYRSIADDLEKNHPDFFNLMNEFRDGILLFKVEAQEVWDKLKFDTLMAKKYFDTTSQKWYTTPVYDISEIFVLDQNLADSIYDRIKAGDDFGKLAEIHTQRGGMKEKMGKRGKLNQNDDYNKKLINMELKKGDITQPFEMQNGFAIVKVDEFYPTRIKTFEEAIPNFAPILQDIKQKKLTEEWLDKVKKTIKIEKFDSNLVKTIEK